MLGLAPWIIELLYSNQFGEATTVLRWQVLGDILKVASWPMGFIILAAGDGRTFLLTESSAIVVFVVLTWVGLPMLGIEAAGIAFVGMYVFYLPIVFLLARRRTGFAWQRSVYVQFVVLIGMALIVFLAALWSKWLGAGFGVIAAAALGLHGLARLGHMANLGGPAGRISAKSRQLMMKMGIWRE
jgi:PST family polysaccharide transporter